MNITFVPEPSWQEPMSRLEQFAGVPQPDDDLADANPKKRGPGRPKAAKAKGKATAKSKAKAKAKANPKGKGRGKGQGKGKAEVTQDAEETLVTPKRKATKANMEEGSRSKKRQPSKTKQPSSDKPTPKPRKQRSPKGEAVSFARRNQPSGDRGGAEWMAIKTVFGKSLMHLTPRSKHEDTICFQILFCKWTQIPNTSYLDDHHMK